MENKKQHHGITILGLGPGSSDLLTVEAKNWLEEINTIYLRTSLHPTTDALPQELEVHSFDNLYEECEGFEEVYRKIVETILELGKTPQGVTYAVPGHPYVAEATSLAIVKLARENNIPVRIIEGISFITPVLTALQIDPFPELHLIDALELEAKHVPPFSPSSPVFVAQIYSRMVASEVKMNLNNIYPDEHPVRLIHDAGGENCIIEDLLLYEIDRSERIGLRTVLYLPPLDQETSFEAFQEVVARLRAPDGCPWDRKQTHQSLRQYLLEESYELLEALDHDDAEKMSEELGDLLLQILLHTQIGAESGEFNMGEVLTGIHRKIIRRHPHVFGDVKVDGADEVIITWENVKREERREKGEGERPVNLLESVPRALPALTQAQEIQERAARVGFDWIDIAPVYNKVIEEFKEVQEALQSKERQDELGDLLFAVVNLARWLGVDAETSLRLTNQRFKKRFGYIEKRVEEIGKNLNEMTLEELDVFWEQAKDEE